MGKVNLEHNFYSYPRYYVYRLANNFGVRLLDFLGKDLIKLLLDTEVLISHYHKDLSCISEDSYKLHPSAKALEGFLKKVLNGKKLREDTNDQIGDVFGGKQSIARKKMRDPRLIAKVKTVWDYCRNDIMHYGGRKLTVFDLRKKNDEIKEIILEIFIDLYGKSVPSDKISEIYEKESSENLKKNSKSLKKSSENLKKTIREIKKSMKKTI